MKLSQSFATVLATGLATGLFSSAALAQGTTPAASSAATTAASAGPAGPAKVAIIQFQAAVVQTNEGKRDLEELEKKYQPKQTQLKASADEIDGLKKSLQSQSATLTDVDRAQKLKTIDDKEKALQRAGEDAQNDFQQEQQQVFGQVAQKVYGTLQAYAQQNGFTLVLDTSQQQSPVLYATDNNNITEAVIAAYNTKSGIAAPPPSAPSPAGTRSTAPSTTAPARRAPAAH